MKPFHFSTSHPTTGENDQIEAQAQFDASNESRKLAARSAEILETIKRVRHFYQPDFNRRQAIRRVLQDRRNLQKALIPLHINEHQKRTTPDRRSKTERRLPLKQRLQALQLELQLLLSYQMNLSPLQRA